MFWRPLKAVPLIEIRLYLQKALTGAKSMEETALECSRPKELFVGRAICSNSRAPIIGTALCGRFSVRSDSFHRQDVRCLAELFCKRELYA
jgi:hypothetical protein